MEFRYSCRRCMYYFIQNMEKHVSCGYYPAGFINLYARVADNNARIAENNARIAENNARIAENNARITNYLSGIQIFCTLLVNNYA